MGAFGDFFNKAKSYLSFRDFLNEVKNGNAGYVAAYLKKNPADLDRQETLSGMNALMFAAMTSASATVKLLLEKGASLRGQDNSGYTVLHLAVLCSPKAITDMLLQSADAAAIINEKNRLNGMTALMYAATIPEDPLLVRSLLEKGANPAAKDFMGRTALSIAREKGYAQTVAVLEQWKPTPQQIRRRGATKPKRFDL